MEKNRQLKGKKIPEIQLKSSTERRKIHTFRPPPPPIMMVRLKTANV